MRNLNVRRTANSVLRQAVNNEENKAVFQIRIRKNNIAAWPSGLNTTDVPLPFFLFGMFDYPGFKIGHSLFNVANRVGTGFFDPPVSGWQSIDMIEPGRQEYMPQLQNDPPIGILVHGLALQQISLPGDVLFRYRSQIIPPNIFPTEVWLNVTCREYPYTAIRDRNFTIENIDYYIDGADRENWNLPIIIVKFNGFKKHKVDYITPVSFRNPAIRENNFIRITQKIEVNKDTGIYTSFFPTTNEIILNITVSF